MYRQSSLKITFDNFTISFHFSVKLFHTHWLEYWHISCECMYTQSSVKAPPTKNTSSDNTLHLLETTRLSFIRLLELEPSMYANPCLRAYSPVI